MTRFFSLLACLIAAPALAQTGYETAYFNVSGVAPDDTLNIRAEPDIASDILGELAFDAVNIEVVGREGGWAMINMGDMPGWISFTYLQQTEPELLESGLPVDLMCGGTEPFWSAQISNEAFVFNAFWAEEESISYPVNAAPRAHSIGFPVFLMLDGGGVASLAPNTCSDGMSDATYGWTLNAVLPGQYETAYSGCCTLRRE
jgi:uncharacterized membrane protein